MAVSSALQLELDMVKKNLDSEKLVLQEAEFKLESLITLQKEVSESIMRANAMANDLSSD